MKVGDSCIVWVRDGRTWLDRFPMGTNMSNIWLAKIFNEGKIKMRANSVVRVKEIKLKYKLELRFDNYTEYR